MRIDLDPDYLKRFLNETTAPSQIRGAVIVLLLFLVDFFMGVQILADPYEPIYRNVLLFPILCLHLYALWIAATPYKRQLDVQLYFAVFGVFCFIGYWVLLQKILYSFLELKSPAFLIGSAVLYVTIAFFTMRWFTRRIYDGQFYTSLSVAVAAPGAGAGLGVALGHLALGYADGKFAVAGLAAAWTLIAWALFSLSVVAFHRYKLARQHPELFVWEKCSKQIQQGKLDRRKGNAQKNHKG